MDAIFRDVMIPVVVARTRASPWCSPGLDLPVVHWEDVMAMLSVLDMGSRAWRMLADEYV
jgi:hypothetical protein